MLSVFLNRPMHFRIAAIAAIALIIAAGILWLPRFSTQPGEGIRLGATPAWAASEEYALVFTHDQASKVDRDLHNQMKAVGDEWGRQMNLDRGLEPDAQPVGRFIKLEENQQLTVFAIYPGASENEVKHLQQQLAAIPGAPSGEIQQATLFFPEGVPPIESGIVTTVSDRIFCIPDNVDEDEVHEELVKWLHEHWSGDGAHSPGH